jgi:hypothetical protein
MTQLTDVTPLDSSGVHGNSSYDNDLASGGHDGCDESMAEAVITADVVEVTLSGARRTR